jgi:hypothetical protein
MVGKIMEKGEGLTWPQILYWVVAGLLFIIGLAAVIGSQWVCWDWLQLAIRETGVASMVAGLLAGLVEPFFRKEFARDAFLASFRYVLPEEFKEEVKKIIRHEFIAESQVWRVKIERVNSGNVRITTTYERKFKNITTIKQPVCAWYQVNEFGFPDGPTRVVGCAIKVDTQAPIEIDQEVDKGDYKESKTRDGVYLEPGKSATVWGEAIQYRRENDIYFEAFRTPIKNPEIVVEIDEKEFAHFVEFGTTGDKKKSQYENRYTLRGVYFPGQYMYVRWWPKQATAAT